MTRTLSSRRTPTLHKRPNRHDLRIPLQTPLQRSIIALPTHTRTSPMHAIRLHGPLLVRKQVRNDRARISLARGEERGVGGRSERGHVVASLPEGAEEGCYGGGEGDEEGEDALPCGGAVGLGELHLLAVVRVVVEELVHGGR